MKLTNHIDFIGLNSESYIRIISTITLGRPTARLGQKTILVGQTRIWVGHGLPGLIARTATACDMYLWHVTLVISYLWHLVYLWLVPVISTLDYLVPVTSYAALVRGIAILNSYSRMKSLFMSDMCINCNLVSKSIRYLIILPSIYNFVHTC